MVEWQGRPSRPPRRAAAISEGLRPSRDHGGRHGDLVRHRHPEPAGRAVVRRRRRPRAFTHFHAEGGPERGSSAASSNMTAAMDDPLPDNVPIATVLPRRIESGLAMASTPHAVDIRRRRVGAGGVRTDGRARRIREKDRSSWLIPERVPAPGGRGASPRGGRHRHPPVVRPDPRGRWRRPRPVPDPGRLQASWCARTLATPTDFPRRRAASRVAGSPRRLGVGR